MHLIWHAENFFLGADVSVLILVASLLSIAMSMWRCNMDLLSGQ